MPGQINRTVTDALRTVQVEAELHSDDEAHLVAHAGQWVGDYAPRSTLRLYSRAGHGAPVRISATGEGLAGEALGDFRAAVREFFMMPAAHQFVGRIFRGEPGYRNTGGPERGISGADEWRSAYQGASYDMHDGSGSFIVTAPEQDNE